MTCLALIQSELTVFWKFDVCCFGLIFTEEMLSILILCFILELAFDLNYVNFQDTS